MKILVTGSTAYDVFLGYDGSFADAIDPTALDTLSMSFFSPHYARHHGGTAANIAWNLQLLGGDPLMVSTVGRDGDAIIELFESNGIDTTSIERIDSEVTATAIIGTDTGQRQIVFFHPGADSVGSFPNLSDVRSDISYAIISPRNPTLMLQAVEWCIASDVPYFFDPSQQVVVLSDDQLRYGIENAHGVFANAYEWELISKRLQMDQNSILDHVQMLIVTHGKDGVSCTSHDVTVDIPACTVSDVKNPTGAGDAFRAGFLYGLDTGKNTTESLQLGSAMGAYAVESASTMLEAISYEDVLERCNNTYKI